MLGVSIPLGASPRWDELLEKAEAARRPLFLQRQVTDAAMQKVLVGLAAAVEHACALAGEHPSPQADTAVSRLLDLVADTARDSFLPSGHLISFPPELTVALKQATQGDRKVVSQRWKDAFGPLSLWAASPHDDYGRVAWVGANAGVASMLARALAGVDQRAAWSAAPTASSMRVRTAVWDGFESLVLQMPLEQAQLVALMIPNWAGSAPELINAAFDTSGGLRVDPRLAFDLSRIPGRSSSAWVRSR